MKHLINHLVNHLARFFLISGLLWLSVPVQATVMMKNGNFFVSYVDLIYPGGFEPKVERVYNSKTSYKGIFGWGWGNEYEVYLTVSDDGSVLVHEYGGGAENRFSPRGTNNLQEVERAVNEIAAAAQGSGAMSSASALASYKTHLKGDSYFRNKEWEKYLNAGKVQVKKLPNNTQLVSNKFSYQYITKVEGGYVRVFDSGKVETYQEANCRVGGVTFACGRVMKVANKNGDYLNFSYRKDGHLEKIEDNFNRKIFFTFNDHGFVEKVEGIGGKISEYKYNGIGQLVYSKDGNGNVYTFKYDNRHNMLEIVFSDKTTQVMAYYGMDKNENVKSLKDRDGTLTEYQYDHDSADRGHFWIAVTTKGSDGKVFSKSKYEYFLKYGDDGEEWTYRMISTLDGDKTETTYNKCCGLPILIKHGNEETSFEYDKGHVTKKDTPSETIKLVYDPEVNKVTRVDHFPKGGKIKPYWSAFEYEKTTGNMKFAKNSEGKWVKIFNDSNGRIKTLVDQDKHQIDFEYNGDSRPIKISDHKLGTITVSYANSGEVAKVESSASREIARQVMTAFQNLIDIMHPAGISLSF